MKPTIGRIVVYNTTEKQQQMMDTLGCNVQEQLPAVVVAVWGDTEDAVVNLKVILDGRAPDLWVTSINRGDGPGLWNWPKREG